MPPFLVHSALEHFSLKFVLHTNTHRTFNVFISFHWQSAAKCVAFIFPCVYELFASLSESVWRARTAIETKQVYGHIVVYRIGSVRLNTEEERSPLPRFTVKFSLEYLYFEFLARGLFQLRKSVSATRVSYYRYILH